MPTISFPDVILSMFGGMLPFAFPIPFGLPLSMDAVIIDLLLLFAISFLIGSIPWGLIISKLFYKTDVREKGSGNIGATNVTRTVGKVGGAAVFLLDFAKGLASGLLGSFMAYGMLSSGYENGCIALAVPFLGCVLGHVYSPWLGFKGGKGIAVAIGCLFYSLGIWISIIELLIFIVIVVSTRYISLGSIVAAAVEPFFALYVFWGDWFGFILMTIAALVIVWAHRSNISRLASGSENRFGSKRAKGGQQP